MLAKKIIVNPYRQMKKYLLVLFSLLALAGCASNQPKPPQYETIWKPGAVVKDTAFNTETSKANFCALIALNSASIENSIEATQAATAGRGMQLQNRLIERVVPPGKYSATIRCQTVYAMPIQAIFSGSSSVEGKVEFSSQTGRTYAVKGILSEPNVSVWIEDTGLAQPVTEKVQDSRK